MKWFSPPFAFDKATIAAGTMFLDPQGRVLLVKRADDGGNFVNHWALPGGGGEPDETPEETATREAREELGCEPDGKKRLLAMKTTPTGMTFYTFTQRVSDAFTPKLNAEHTEFKWCKFNDLPEPMHPAVAATLKDMAQDARPMAFDRASTVRTYDEDGRLRVSSTHISKANICPYRGSEIPDSEALGLDADKIYYLLRDPDELAKAAPTFNALPVLDEHLPVNVFNHEPDHVIGATGTDAVFEYPYLDNSLVLWVGKDIDDVENELRKELSCAYRYRADMTPGTWQGVKYDGVMRDIVGNHVALVKEGRAGSDVVIGDSTTGELLMSKTRLTRSGLMAQGALLAFLTPRLAKDSKIDLMPVLSVIGKAIDPAVIVKSIKPLVEGKLAKDANIDDMANMLDVLKDKPVGDDDPMPVEEDDDAAMDADKDTATMDAVCDYAKSKGMDEASVEEMKGLFGKKKADDAAEETPEAKAKREEAEKAKDAEMKPEDKPVTKGAMDAAIKKAKSEGAKEATAIQRGIDEARRFVKPWVGELAIAFDSAEGVHRAACEALGVEVDKDLDPKALPAIIKAQRKPSALRENDMANDSAVEPKGYAERWPTAGRITVLG